MYLKVAIDGLDLEEKNRALPATICGFRRAGSCRTHLCAGFFWA